MPRFELKDGTSPKLWEIQRGAGALTIRLGRLHVTFGHTDTVGHTDAAPIEKPAAERPAPAERPVPAAPTEEPAAQPSAKLEARQYEAMGPALAHIQRQAEENGRNEWDEILQLKWSDGAIAEARVASYYDWQGTPALEVFQAVLESPNIGSLHTLKLGNLLDDSGMGEYGEYIRAIAEAGEMPGLRHLHIGDFDYPTECEISWTQIGDVSPIYPVAPNLESLHLQGGGIDLGELKHARLQRLKLETGGLPADAVRAVASANLPELVDLEMWLGDEGYGAEGDLDMIKPILAGKRFPKLERLGLLNAEFTNEIARALMSSAILPRLRSLDLSLGTLGDVGAKAMVENVVKLRHLESLNLNDNFVGETLSRALRQALGDVVKISDQDEPDEWDGETNYYVSVGE